MALTPSNMLPLGQIAPNFSLSDGIEDVKYSLNDIQGKKGTLLMFICNHCPYVKHIMEELVHIGNEYMPKGIGMLAINSNDVENYPDDKPTLMRLTSKAYGFPFLYLFDNDQTVAKAYDAACTPDFYLLDEKHQLVYRGRLDDSRPGNTIPVTGESLRAAMNALILGTPISDEQIPSLGCNIKWKK